MRRPHRASPPTGRRRIPSPRRAVRRSRRATSRALWRNACCATTSPIHAGSCSIPPIRRRRPFRRARSFPSRAAPSGWLLCFGQAISRTTYAALFAAIGTSFGAGDGSTTFNIPDLRGRAAFGLDNMGGSAAGRITSAGSGIAGTTLGATGGDEHMQAHGHTATVTDPGHAHGMQGYDPYSGGIHGGPRLAYTADAELSSP